LKDEIGLNYLKNVSRGLYMNLLKCYNQMMSLDAQVRGYFWDIDPESAIPKKHPKYYMTRILEEGDKQAVSWLFRMFGKNEVRKLLPSLRLSEKSTNYWQHYFYNSSEK
jgi:hypothetical protein